MKLTARHRRIIKRRARLALLKAITHGVRLEMEDLEADGYVAFMRAAMSYRPLDRGGQSFDSYLGVILENAYFNTLRAVFARKRFHHQWRPLLKRHSLFMVGDPAEGEEHQYPAPPTNTETELMELVQHYCALLDCKLDKQVLFERVFPSRKTCNLALLQSLRKQHLLAAFKRRGSGNLLGRASVNPEVSIEVLATVLRVKQYEISKSLTRIRKLLSQDFRTNHKE